MANGTILTIETQDNLDERLRKKLNNNFSSLKDAFKKVWNIATDPYYHFDVVYPVGCLVWTTTEDDPRFRRGTWEKVEDTLLISQGPEHPDVDTVYERSDAITVVTSVSGDGVSYTTAEVHGRPAITVKFLYERTA